MNNFDYKNMTTFKWFVLENFPFIENDFDSINNYHLFSKVVEYLNQTIDNMNLTGTQMENLTNAMTELQNYVNNYFNNLDVQEEINNKLDEMAEGGYFDNILANYVNLKRIYNTTIEMLEDNENFVKGMKIQTLGYYSINDGGGANFIVTDTENSATLQFAFENGLYCDMIIENNRINFRQLGAKPLQIDDTKTDCKTYMEKYIDILNNNERRIRLYIPDGIWHFSPTKIFAPRGYFIYGDEGMIQKNDSTNGTILTTLEDNSPHLFLIGDETTKQTNCVIKKCLFSSSDYEFSNETNSFIFKEMKEVIDTCVRIQNTQFLLTDKLFFEYIHGQALGITTSWELYFDLLNFRAIAGYNKAVLNFEPLLIQGGNISACNFNKVMFEGFTKNLINISNGCGLAHCDFNTINIEDYRMEYLGEEYKQVENDTDFTDFVHLSIFNYADSAYAQCLIVNNILLNNIATHYEIYNGISYIFDRIVNCGNAIQTNLTIDNISTVGIRKDCDLLYSPKNKQVNPACIFTFNNCTCNNLNYGFKFNVDEFKGNINANPINLNLPTQDKFNKIGGLDGFYNFLRSGTIPRGLICYDKECINQLKLTTKILRNDETGNKIFARFPSFTNTFKIRAKISDGETVVLVYRDESQPSSANVSVSLVGTGSYKWYEIFTQSPSPDGILQISGYNVPVDCYIDCVSYN